MYELKVTGKALTSKSVRTGPSSYEKKLPGRGLTKVQQTLRKRLSQPQDHSAAGTIMSMKISNDTIGNRNRDLPTYSAVPQPTAPPAACPTHVVELRDL